jgi:hypothetical protein
MRRCKGKVMVSINDHPHAGTRLQPTPVAWLRLLSCDLSRATIWRIRKRGAD